MIITLEPQPCPTCGVEVHAIEMTGEEIRDGYSVLGGAAPPSRAHAQPCGHAVVGEWTQERGLTLQQPSA